MPHFFVPPGGGDASRREQAARERAVARGLPGSLKTTLGGKYMDRAANTRTRGRWLYPRDTKCCIDRQNAPGEKMHRRAGVKLHRGWEPDDPVRRLFCLLAVGVGGWQC